MKHDYTLSRNILQFTSIIFFTQIFFETGGIIERNDGFGWVLPACGILWVLSLIYAIALVVMNSLKEVKK